MNICVGLLSLSHAWEQILLQEGVPWRVVDAATGLSLDEVSVLVINRPVDEPEKAAIEQYLRAGGAILGAAQMLTTVHDMHTRQEWIEYVHPSDDDPLHGLSVCDLGIMGEIPKEANALRTQAGVFAIFAGQIGSGIAVALPFDPEIALTDLRVAAKNFYAQRERLPSERVSLVGKGEIHHLLHASLEYLHHQRGIPYVHLWYFPEDLETVFAFRVDTDSATKTEIEALYATARETDIPLTWFLDVRSHESWLQHFAAMSGQEIGVHCFEHRVFDSYEESLKDIGKARQMLELLGIRPSGYAAPFGMWNPALAKAVDSLGFFYASEFSLAYDMLPLYPPTRTGSRGTLQVPIHPICPGSLTKVGYSEAEAGAYFTAKVEEKIQRAESIIFYHHPGQRAWKTIRSLFTLIRERGIECMTMGEYARWWTQRLGAKFTARVEGDQLHLEFEGDAAGGNGRQVRLRITTGPGKELRVPFAPRLNLKQVPDAARVSYRPPADVRRAREFDSRAMLGDLYTKMVRKLR